MINGLKHFWNRHDVSMKLMLFSIVLFLVLTFILLNIRQAFAVSSIRDITVIERNTVHLGDIFDDIEGKADIVLGYAPSPGEEMIIGTQALARLAESYGINWRPGGFEQVVIKRSASVIGLKNITELIEKHLREKGHSEKINITFLGEVPEIILPGKHKPSAEIKDFEYNHRTGRFHATLVAPSIEKPLQKISVKGAVEQIVEIPVLAERMQNGDIIGFNDVVMMEVRHSALESDILVKQEDLIGMTPKRIILPGRPVIQDTIQKPLLVERGESVTLVYTSNVLKLTTKGKAMQDGSEGDLIRIMNLDSNRFVQGIVKNNGVVEVYNG